MQERHYGWATFGVSIVIAGLAAMVWLIPVGDAVVIVGVYLVIAALVPLPPFRVWVKMAERRPASYMDTSASPSAISERPPSSVSIKWAKFGRPDQGRWANVTKTVQVRASNGRLDMVASVGELQVDLSHGFTKVLRIKYRVDGGSLNLVEFPEGERVILP